MWALCAEYHVWASDGEGAEVVTKLPLGLPFEMIENPDLFIAAFADGWCGHGERAEQEAFAGICIGITLQLIQSHGMLAGVVINPDTPVDMLIEVLPMVGIMSLVMSVNLGFGWAGIFAAVAGEDCLPGGACGEAMGLNSRIEVDGGIAQRYGGDGWSKQERICWWPGRRSLRRAGRRRMRGSFWRWPGCGLCSDGQRCSRTMGRLNEVTA